MSLDIIFGNIQSFAAFIAAVITIGSSLMWVYQQRIGKAKERRIEEQNRLLREKIEDSNKPLIETLNKLNDSMKEREIHDDKLDEIAGRNTALLKNHDEQLVDHNERLIVLEVKNDVQKIGYIKNPEGDTK